jgi:hypothetical protein
MAEYGPKKNETYIGDGVYVSFDGFQIWLRAPRDNGNHVIALEPDVFNSLVAYRQHLIDSSLKRKE